MSEPLPDFAKQWMSQWRNAAEELEEVRQRELRQLSDRDAIRAAEIMDQAPSDGSLSGLIIQQQWFTRFLLLQRMVDRGNETS